MDVVVTLSSDKSLFLISLNLQVYVLRCVAALISAVLASAIFHECLLISFGSGAAKRKSESQTTIRLYQICVFQENKILRKAHRLQKFG